MIKNFIEKEREFEKKVTPYVDKIFYLGAILSPLSALPQAITIYTQESAAGVSFVTWALYLGASLALFVYGYLHRQKPLMVMNVTVLPVYLAILFGIYIY